MTRRCAILWCQLAIIPLAFLIAGLLIRAWLHGAPSSIGTGLQQPLPVATTWHNFGKVLWAIACAGIVTAAIPYALLVQGLVRGERHAGLGAIVGFSALSLLAALSMPVIFSSDVYAYAAYGLMDANGISPYAHATLSSHDPLIRAAIWQWSNPLPVCVYGPLFVWIAKVCVLSAASFGTAAQLLLLRVVSAAALLACGPLAYLAFAGFSAKQRLAAAAGLILNPVVIWAAAEGHNDTLVLAVVLLGFIAMRKFGYLIGTFIIASSALIKASGAAAAGVLALYAWPVKNRFYNIVGGLAGGIFLTGMVARPFESGVGTTLLPHGHYMPQFSLQYIAAEMTRTLFGNHAHSLEFGIAIAVVASGAMALHGVRLALRGELQGAAFIALGLWLLIPNPYPWYALWILPVAFLCVRTPGAWAIIAASITIFVRYLPDASSASPDLNVVVTLCEVALPLVILTTQSRWLPRPGLLESDPSA